MAARSIKASPFFRMGFPILRLVPLFSTGSSSTPDPVEGRLCRDAHRPAATRPASAIAPAAGPRRPPIDAAEPGARRSCAREASRGRPQPVPASRDREEDAAGPETCVLLRSQGRRGGASGRRRPDAESPTQLFPPACSPFRPARLARTCPAQPRPLSGAATPRGPRLLACGVRGQADPKGTPGWLVWSGGTRRLRAISHHGTRGPPFTPIEFAAAGGGGRFSRF